MGSVNKASQDLGLKPCYRFYSIAIIATFLSTLIEHLLHKLLYPTCPLPLLEWSCIGPGPVPNPPTPLLGAAMGVVGTTFEWCITEDVSTGF